MAGLIRGLEEAFAFFGGVPAELLFDQMKAVIIDDARDIGGRLLENAEFLRFAAHWGFRVRARRPARRHLGARAQAGSVTTSVSEQTVAAANRRFTALPTRPHSASCAWNDYPSCVGALIAVVVLSDTLA